MRLASGQGLWGYVFPFAVVMAASAIYEIMEWLVVRAWILRRVSLSWALGVMRGTRRRT